MDRLTEVAMNISTPLGLAGLLVWVILLAFREMVRKGLFRQLTRPASERILTLFLTRLIYLAIVASILGFLGYVIAQANAMSASIGAPDSSRRFGADDEFKKQLFVAIHELRNNREFLSAIHLYRADTSLGFPIGNVRVAHTLALLESHHDKVLGGSYGEEKYVYQLALRLRDAADVLVDLSSREAFTKFDDTYEMTIDDLAFLSGFLGWYIAVGGQIELTQLELNSLGWGALDATFCAPDDATKLKMKYFVFEGQPITDYGVYLALID